MAAEYRFKYLCMVKCFFCVHGCLRTVYFGRHIGIHFHQKVAKGSQILFFPQKGSNKYFLKNIQEGRSVISRNMSRNITYPVLGTLEVLSAREISKAAFIVRKWQFKSNLFLNLKGSTVSLSKSLRSKYKESENKKQGTRRTQFRKEIAYSEEMLDTDVALGSRHFHAGLFELPIDC